jgi:hypothetical protein
VGRSQHRVNLANALKAASREIISRSDSPFEQTLSSLASDIPTKGSAEHRTPRLLSNRQDRFALVGCE